MKFKTTKKAIMNSFKNVISVGYGESQYLLNGRDAIAYYANVYGWRADIYQIDDNAAIVTGYEPFGNIEPKHEIVRKYDKKAREYYYNGNTKKINSLLKKFINEVIK